MTQQLSVRSTIRLAAIFFLGAIVLHASVASAQSPLGAAQSFAVLGAASASNTGPTIVTGGLGTFPGTVIAGFPPGIIVGTVHAGDPAAGLAQADARIANTGFKAMACPAFNNLTGQVLGGTILSLPPGVYCFNTSAQLTGTLHLTGAGPWIFQIGSTLITAANAAVIVSDAGPTCGGHNVFWQVGSSATIGVGTSFAGTVLAEASATVMTGASVSGSVIALTAAVTLDANAVSVCEPPPVVPANEPPVAAAGADQVIPFGSIATLDGSASTDDGRLQPLSYAWVSDTGFSAAGKIATASLPLGRHVVTLTVNDGEFSSSDSVTITIVDVTAPTIAIAAPVANAAYALAQVVLASYTCSDASGIASCIGTVASGAAIDTSSPGIQSFCVTAVDSAANTATRCVSYSVLEPPVITVTSPMEPIYELGGLVLATYSCGNAATCTASVENGNALDTSTSGLKSFTITATDAANNTTTQVVTYSVSLGMCSPPQAGLAAWLTGDGSATDTVTAVAATWAGVEGYGAGKAAQALSVGAGRSLSLPFEQAGAFTLQAWIRASDRLLPEFTGVLSTGAPSQKATSLQIELDGRGNYRLNAGDSTVSSLLGPALDFFQHVAVTFDGSTLTTYLNGQLVQREAWAGSPALGFQVLNVGIDRDGLHPFTGLVDETQVFNRALSGAEIAQTFLTGASGLCTTRPVAAPSQSPLGSAASFAVLGGSIVTNVGPTHIAGDLGVSPGTSVTGIPPGVVTGTVHAADVIAAQAQADALTAYNQLKGLSCLPANNLTGQVLGSTVLSLPSGVYCFDTSAQITGTLFLTGTGPWIFQMGSTLISAGNAAVVVSDAGATCSGANVFWQVGSSATLGARTTFAGTVLALASITVSTGASVSGSVLALNGAVTLDANNISVCEAAPVEPPNQPPVANAGLDQAVPFASAVTLDGSASSDDGRIQPLTYAWVSDTGFSATGQVATLTLPLGRHVFTLTVNDGEFSASDSVTITVVDVTAPAITIAAPIADAAYSLDQTVFASFTCADQSGTTSCTGTVASGAPIDTSSAGLKTFCVTAVDGAGNTSSQCVSYSVLEPPTITVTSPIEPIYELGSLVYAAYSCGAGATCTANVASGGALDTSTSGLKSFTITATDAAGNTTTQVVTYSVSLGSCVAPFAGQTAWLAGEGNAVDTVTGAMALWTGTEAFGPGKVAQAFSVGAGSVSLPFQQAGAFTLQAWVRASDRLLPEFTGVLSTGGPGQNATSFQIELDGTGNYRLNAGDSAVSTLLGPALDFFQHVAVTFDGSTLTTYLNGQLVQSEVWGGSPGLGFHALNVGIDRGGVLRFTGLVDEVQAYNRALSADEVGQTFLTGALGLCNNRPPVAVAVATPNPAEATGPDGAVVTLDGTGSSDPDHDTLTCTWHEGATLLGTGCVLPTQLATGSHTITLTVDDGQGETATADIVVVVRDTAGPALTVPSVVFAEATSPLGAMVLYAASATDLVSGAAAITCVPASGSIFAIGSTLVTCSATDAAGNITSVTFNVVVRDTIAPDVQIVTSPDAAVSGSPLTVVVRASDIVGVVAVTVNGVAATRTAGTAQAGTWSADVPVTLPVAPGSVLRFDVRALDAAGNVGTATLVIDNDGIPAAMDRNRITGADESGIYSNDFVNGTTAGTLTRSGWAVRLSSAPTANGVRVSVSGSGGIARISACTGAAKEVRLDVIGETADITCAAAGTITVKAISAVLQIEVREQLATGAWQQFNLRTGQSMSVGSPATANTANGGSIAVDLVQIDGAGRDIIVGSYQLQPGASVDVSALARARGRDGEFRFKVLKGSVSMTVSGRSRTLKAGKNATMIVDRISATMPLPAIPLSER